MIFINKQIINSIYYEIKISALFFIFTISCKSPDSEILQIDSRNWKENKILLSEIGDAISYLTMDNVYPFKTPISVPHQITKNSIIIFIGNPKEPSSTMGLVKYDRGGKLIKKIGYWGRGSEEYMSSNFTCDYETGTIYILNNGDNIKIYSSEGTFVRDISLKAYGNSFKKIDFYNSKLFMFDYPGLGKTKYNWIIIDTLGNLIDVKENPLPEFSNPIVVRGGTYRYNNRLFYWNSYNDTVYSILPDLTYNAAYLFARGTHRWSTSSFNPEENIDLYQLMTNHLIPILLFETDNFLVFLYGYLDKYPVAFIEKESREIFLNSRIISNDIDGGLMFDPMFSFYLVENNNEFLTGFIDVFKLKTHIASDAFKNATPKHPDKKKDLEKFAARLKDTDNPVMMIVRLKK